MGSVDIAFQIALSNLRSLYGEKGIFAGSRHFKDYWGRDSFFASFGSLAAKDYEIVRKNLELHLSYMDKTGQLPLRIGASSAGVALAYIGLKSDKKIPLYTTDKNNFSPSDQNSLFIIALHEYVSKTRNIEFLKNRVNSIERAIAWNFMNDEDKDLLFEENEYCNWADSIRKKGKVLYTNVCHCHALRCMSDLYKTLGDKHKQAYYMDLHQKVKKKINEIFWTGEHYLDWIDGDKHYNYFSTDGNILAIIWDIAGKEKALQIVEAAHMFEINEIPSACVHPSYPKRLVAPEIRLVGLGDYHSGVSWLWLGCISALAKDKLGMKKEALSLLEEIAEIIIQDNGVYEIYEPTGEPVNRLIYKAEFPFAWSAGLFVYAVKKLNPKK